MFRNRKEYWSNSKLADKIRGSTKLNSATMDEWDLWKKHQQFKSPIRYWIAEEALDTLQDIVLYPYDLFSNLSDIINNRFVSKVWMVDTGLNRNKYYEIETRMLCANFEMLVDFVEVEKAWMSVVWDDEKRAKYKPHRWFSRMRNWRCPEAGLEYLEWERGLTHANSSKLTGQALAAQETLELYNWWKHIRPARKCPYEMEEDAIAKTGKSFDVIVQEYDDEDTDMLLRLVKIRKELWT